MLQWKFGDITNKLEDIYARLMKFLKDDPMLDEMKTWLDRLREFNDDDSISQDMADEFATYVERWNDGIKRKISPD